MRALPHVLHHGLNHHGGFPGIATILKDAAHDKVMLHAERRIIVIRGGIDDQVTLIKLLIGKCNETVVT